MRRGQTYIKEKVSGLPLEPEIHLTCGILTHLVEKNQIEAEA